MYRILVVDDEAKIRLLIRKYAEFEGHEVTEAENGMEAVRLFRKTPDAFDIVIMDVMMPELDGFSAVAEIKKIASPAVIMLSARGEEYDKIHGFELGVDDYVVKPFSPKELMMRVAAVMSRVQRTAIPKHELFRAEGLTIDFTGRIVTVDGVRADLSPKEYDLLFYMVNNRNIALIMEGRTPVARTLAASDSSRISKVLVMPSPEDSLLRAQMEGDGEYAIAPRSEGSRRKIREAIELATPVEGIITGRFDIKQGNFGVKIAAAAGDRIAAIDNGTVVQSLWAPEAGYTVVLQHAGNLISIYKNLSQSLVSVGQTIRSGELIGYNAEAENGEVKLFEFELWNNGKPVDPEGYIVF